MNGCTRLLSDLRERARDDPGKAAATDASGHVTLSEFWSRIGRTANLLRSRGVGPGDAVAIGLGRTVDHLAARYAALVVGAAAVSLSPEHPESRRKAVAEACGAVAVIDEGFVQESLGMPDDAEPVDLPDDMPGYIAFTSGSTGEPKGAVHERSVFPYLMDCYASSGLDFGGTRFGSLSDFSFIASMVETHIALFAGAEVVVIDRSSARDAGSLLRAFAEERIECSLLNPSVYSALQDRLNLKVCLLAGEAVRRIHVPEGTVVLDVYGSTEALMSFTRVEDMEEPRVDTTEPGCRLWLADDGEILFSGRGIMKGYIGGLENPFATIDGKRVFRTGDLGRRIGGGIAVVGRMDRMVKVRGYRVEPAEAEMAMAGIAGVDEAAVKAFSDDSGAYLCGYYSGTASEDDVRSALEAALPEYMVPQFLSRMASFPRNANGKIDRAGLATLKGRGSSSAGPENDAQRRVCEAFCRVLGLEKVGIDDDFVRLGGDSVKAMRLQAETGIGVAEIMSLRTPRRLAEVGRPSGDDGVRIEDGCPLNDSQMNVYLDMEANGRNSEYNVFFPIPLPQGTSDEEAIRALRTVVDAHPVLRCRIASKDGEPWLVADADPEVCGSDDEGFEDRPFDTAEGMCRLSVGNGEARVCACHIAVDGLSARILEEDLMAALRGEDLPTDLGFASSSLRDARSRGSERERASLEYFDRMLDGAECDSGLPPCAEAEEAGILDIPLSSDPGKVADLARSAGATTGEALTAAFAYALSRFTGRSDAVFCVIDNGRDMPGLERSVGMFVRTVPVRIDCSDAAVEEFLSRASSTIRGAVSRSCRFSDLAAKHGVSRDVMFQYRAGMGLGGGRSEDSRRGMVSDLSFVAGESDGRLFLRVERSSRYPGSMARRIAAAMDSILSDMGRYGRMSETEPVSREDAEAYRRINDTSRPLVHPTLLEAFRDSAGRFPSNIAVSYLDRKVTYAETDRISDGVASSLAAIGVGKGDMVAVMVPRSEWYLLCALGILKAGAAYVPLDDAYPDERLAHMLSDSGSKAVLVTEDTRSRAESLSSVPVLDCGGLEGSFEPVRVDPMDAAVVLYTSGTTGKPKGSVITHRAIDNMCEWYVGFTGMTEKDVYALYASYSFDVHTMGLFNPMYAGASVDIVPEDVRLDMKRLNEHFVSTGTTHTFMTTQVGKLFASMDMRSGMRFLFYGGEKLGEFHAPDHLGACESYGPSENLALSTAIFVNDRRYSDSVGHLLPNIKAYILDAEKRMVPFGGIGELHLSGYQLSTGYLNREDLNSKVFLENPFTDEPGHERMYATGDFFRMLPDGTLGVVGRRDGQVKIRGNRVELTEVEASIRELPGIVDVSVQAVAAGTGKELCAYIVGSAEGEEVKSWVAQRKPAYMVPAFVIALDAIPRTVNSKVDRRALPVPDASSLRAEYAPPRNEAERKLCEAFEKVLGIGRAGIDDDFIRLGGDSLKAIRVQNLASCASTADILRLRTPRLIADGSRRSGILIRDEKDGMPLSESQLNVYLDLEAKGKAGAYLIPYSFKIPDGKTEADARKALESVFRAQPALRGKVSSRNGTPWMEFDSMPSVCGSLPGSIDVKERMAAFTVSDGDIRGILSHLAFDGMSSSTLSECLRLAFSGSEVPYDDGILRTPAEEDLSEAESFFDRMLDGSDCESGLLPDDNGSPGISEAIIGASAEDISKRASEAGSTAGALLTSAFAYTLSRFTGRSDAVFCIIDNGRDLPGT